MLLRIWKTGFEPSRLDDLKTFADQVSAPMFLSLHGCHGYMYAHEGQEWITMSLWESADVIAAAEATTRYREVVDQIVASGLIMGEQTTEIFELTADVRFD